MVEQRRVVVTGIGVVSPIGNNQKEVKDSLFYNKSGISFSKDYSALAKTIMILVLEVIFMEILI